MYSTGLADAGEGMSRFQARAKAVGHTLVVDVSRSLNGRLLTSPKVRRCFAPKDETKYGSVAISRPVCLVNGSPGSQYVGTYGGVPPVGYAWWEDGRQRPNYQGAFMPMVSCYGVKPLISKEKI